LEDSVATALLDIENSSSELKSELKDLQISKVIEKLLTAHNKKERRVLVVFVPIPLAKLVARSHKKIVPELEKRLKASVLIVLRRSIQSKWIKANRTQKRPRNRTLTAVYDAILEDLVMPANIIGKRIRCRLDGSRILKVILDEADRAVIEDKLDYIKAYYHHLTKRDIVFEFKEDKPFYTIKK